MIAQEESLINVPIVNRLPLTLPPDAETQRVLYVSKSEPTHTVLVNFPPAYQRFAVLVPGEMPLELKPGEREVQILTIPGTGHQDGNLQSIARDWVAAGLSDDSVPVQTMILQGAQLFWSSGRVAMVASQDRLQTLSKVLIEVHWYDTELQSLEQRLATLWSDLDSDIPLAFDFDERSLPRRTQLQDRFKQVMSLRSQIARLSTHVYSPHVHPPTLANQVAERFRERNQMLHRHEILSDQLEVFETVYESCGQRSSDFTHARKGHMLEWLIIVLLLIQIIFSGFDYLTSIGS
jgi:hypothetical protein